MYIVIIIKILSTCACVCEWRKWDGQGVWLD